MRYRRRDAHVEVKSKMNSVKRNFGPPCRICNSSYVLYVQDVKGNRTNLFYPQYYCMDCQSFFHVSGYKETDHQMEYDFNYVYERRDHHYRLQSRLFHEVLIRAPHIKEVCEVGHGLGMLMKAAQDFNCNPVGYEVNPYCHKFVLENLKLPSKCELFTGHGGRDFDLIASIMVFEHLENPRALFQDMTQRLRPDGVILLSVPFVDRIHWPFLWTAQAPLLTTNDPFYENDVHITHFSTLGLEMMGKQFGARSVEAWVSADVNDNSPGSYPVMLFRF